MSLEDDLRRIVAEEVRAALAELRPAAPTDDERASVATLAERCEVNAKYAARKVRAAVRSGRIHPMRVGRALRLTSDEFRLALAPTEDERTASELAGDMLGRRRAAGR